MSWSFKVMQVRKEIKKKQDELEKARRNGEIEKIEILLDEISDLLDKLHFMAGDK